MASIMKSRHRYNKNYPNKNNIGARDIYKDIGPRVPPLSSTDL